MSDKKNILSEAVKVNYITNAIEKRLVVNIYYKGDNTIKPGYRDIEIHKYGLTKAGNEAISAYQVDGVSDYSRKGSEIPGWRLFLVQNIRNWAVKSKTFEPRPGYNSNPDNDGLMPKIFMTVTDIETIGDEIPVPKEPNNNVKKVIGVNKPEPSKPEPKKQPEREPEPEFSKDDELDSGNNIYETIDYQDDFDKLYEIKNQFKNILK